MEKLGIGQHLLADLFGVAPEQLANAEDLRQLLHEAAAHSGLHAIAEPAVIPFQAAEPQALYSTPGYGGVTGFVVLAESHIAFHSYPELGFVAVDVFTCGANARPQAALEVFIARLHPQQTVIRICARGEPPTQ